MPAYIYFPTNNIIQFFTVATYKSIVCYIIHVSLASFANRLCRLILDVATVKCYYNSVLLLLYQKCRIFWNSNHFNHVQTTFSMSRFKKPLFAHP